MSHDQLRNFAQHLRARLGFTGKRLGWIDGDGVQLATQRIAQKSGRNDRSGAVHGIERHVKPAGANALGIHVRQYAVEVQLHGRDVIGNHAPHLLIRSLAEIALMVELDQFSALVIIEEQALGVEQLESVVLGWIVRGRQRDAALRARGSDKNLNRRSRKDADFHHLAASRQQSARYRMREHFAGCASVAAQNHAASADVCAECLRERTRQRGCKELAHHSTDSGNADLQQMFASRHVKQNS